MIKSSSKTSSKPTTVNTRTQTKTPSNKVEFAVTVAVAVTVTVATTNKTTMISFKKFQTKRCSCTRFFGSRRCCKEGRCSDPSGGHPHSTR
jgi:hypothetical protein